MTMNRNKLQIKKIIIYGTASCEDTIMSREFLDSLGCAYAFIDIDKDKVAEAFVISTNNGMRSTPTILFPYGKVLVEPTNSELHAESIRPHDNAM